MIQDEAWLLWGEHGDRLANVDASTADATSTPKEGGGVATAETTVARHPFAATAAEIRVALAGTLAEESMKPREDVVLRLPHDRHETGETPVPGLALATRLAIDAPDTEDLHLAETAVPCVEIDATTAVGLFPAIAERTPEGFVVGHDIRF